MFQHIYTALLCHDPVALWARNASQSALFIVLLYPQAMLLQLFWSCYANMLWLWHLAPNLAPVRACLPATCHPRTA